MGLYLERYVYDEVGNFLEMVHRGTDPTHPGWTRGYDYEEASLLEPGRISNRLTRTTVNGTTEAYRYDAHGNMVFMTPVPLMQWDHRDQLQASATQVRSDGGTPEITYYVYDASGQRVRKVTESQAARRDAHPDEGAHLSRWLRDLPGVRRRWRDRAGARDAACDGRPAADRAGGDQTRDDGIDLASPETRIRYQLGNHLGSTSLELDEAARVISYEEYYPYGSTSYQAVSSAVEVSAKTVSVYGNGAG